MFISVGNWGSKQDSEFLGRRGDGQKQGRWPEYRMVHAAAPCSDGCCWLRDKQLFISMLNT